ncbi:MAG: sigma-54-dependent Fis family transcriptional regulator [Planctomycetota bacterium]|mgnify:FL=1|nr:MAG: sigma-54-dependent Fis family transcriptional regulator [Planctomycetota bacterium]REK23559.1 MAG: sigma-54-dependent Fis family transcriptional regulator [Planctomycetota bacterium]REK46070.1 MAG: sigma-54-dependent Fis family transcriptional regulator [Planctomycetota bacterium]
MKAIVGRSYWTRQIRETIERIAPHTSSVLITGPSGTGKELIARSIHDQSPRATGPFIPVDCASVPGSLFASQLFGHTKGAFTGAVGASLGSFRAASGGTIFLDEVGELDLELQAKLLRVIQQRQVVPVGGHDPEPIDVRIIAATNRDLAAEVKAGRFRLDLFYRLDVISIETKALQDRREDIAPLAEFFIEQVSREQGVPPKRLSPAAVRAIESFDWPGNVRQLQNILERSIVLSEGEEIDADFIPQEIAAAAQPDLQPTGDTISTPNHQVNTPAAATNAEGYPADWQSLEDNERLHLQRTLELTGFNQSAAARLLNIDYRLLLRRIKKYGLKPAGGAGGNGNRPRVAAAHGG